MSRISKINQRQNYHIDASSPTVPFIHIFSTSKNNKMIQSLRKELNNKSYSYQDHQDFHELQSIIPFTKNAIVIIFSEDEDELKNMPANYNWSQDAFAKFYSFPKRLRNVQMGFLQDGKELIRLMEAKSGGGGKIKLASVHSIKVSKDKKIQSNKSLKKITTDNTYQKVFYLRDENEYDQNQLYPYSALIAQLQGEANFYPIKTGKELQKKEAPKGKKKNLILASTSLKSLKAINQIKKGKENYDYLILGNLDPNQKFLQSNVILATQNPLHVIQFLMENNFSSFKIKNLYDRLKKGKGVISSKEVAIENNYAQPQPSKIQNNNKISTIYLPSQEKLADEQPSEKKKIRKIKSPNKTRPSQIESTSEIHNTNIVVNKPTNQIIIQNENFRVNKQGETIFKKPSEKEAVQTPNFHTKAATDNTMNIEGRFDSVAPAVETQFLTKRSSGIESKYRKTPSVIIHEMSDEYRGSNKESIMNLQPQKQKTQINQPYQLTANTQPLQQITVKKVVNKMTFGNEPETYYVSGQTQESIKTIPNLPQNNTYISNNRGNYTYGTIHSNYIAASPMKVTSVNSSRDNNQSNTRTYGYQSPTRIVRKQQSTLPEQVIDSAQQKANQANRITFGSNYYSVSNNQNNANTINNIKASPYSNYVGSYSSNLNNGNNYVSKANNVSSYNISNANIQSNQSIASSANNYTPYTGNTNNITNTNTASNNAVTKTIPNYSANYTDYYHSPTLTYQSTNNEPNRIQISAGKTENILTSPQKATQVRSYGYNNSYASPPKVQEKVVPTNRMASSTLFNSQQYDQIERDGRIVYRKKVVGDSNKQYTPINYVSGVGKVQKGQEGSPSVRRYQLSPVRRQASPYQYVTQDKRKEVSTPYQYGKQEVIASKKNYEVITIPYKGEDQNLGEMIQSSHKKKTISSEQAINKNFVSVSYRNEDKSKQYGGVKVYGSNYPRVQVQKIQRVQPKVQAKVQSSSPAQRTNPLNQSNWFSRMSELHSDGSILRRNNIRFGIKLQKKEEKMESNISVLDNKMVSGIFKVNDLNKKMALNRIIRGEDYIEEQKEKYIHINSKTNRFHYIIQEEMDYLVTLVQSHMANLQDKVDKFAGISSLFNYIKNDDEQAFDAGFIFAKTEEIAHINGKLIPEHYFIVSIQQQQDGLLQINEAQNKIKIDGLKHFSLVQKIILDSKLYQYVAYRNNKAEIQQLADKFLNSQFILEKIQTQFTTEILDCYYYELPRLTRLYVLCDEQQLPKMLQTIQAYSELNTNFAPQTCKLVCVLNNILDNDELIMNEQRVTFISNPHEIKHYRDILKYAHHSEDPYSHFLPIDNLFYYSKHTTLQEDLAKCYPGRFSTFPFNQVSEVYPKIDKMNKIATRHGYQHKNYLVLHQSLNAQKIRVEYFTKIFMLGKAKVIQNKVVRVMNNLELLELLKK